MADERRDWVDWHREYDDPASRLSRRLAVVQRRLREALDANPGPIRLISMCAGEGRDVVGVLREHPRRDEISATLVEADPRNARTARESAARAGLRGVTVIEADAADSSAYAAAVPADIILACGIFGNISDSDISRAIAQMPMLASAGATVLWTRGFRSPDRAILGLVSGWFADAGFEQTSLDAPDEWGYSVGVQRLVGSPRPFEPGVPLFTFIR